MTSQRLLRIRLTLRGDCAEWRRKRSPVTARAQSDRVVLAIDAKKDGPARQPQVSLQIPQDPRSNFIILSSHCVLWRHWRSYSVRGSVIADVKNAIPSRNNATSCSKHKRQNSRQEDHERRALVLFVARHNHRRPCLMQVRANMTPALTHQTECLWRSKKHFARIWHNTHIRAWLQTLLSNTNVIWRHTYRHKNKHKP